MEHECTISSANYLVLNTGYTDRVLPYEVKNAIAPRYRNDLSVWIISSTSERGTYVTSNDGPLPIPIGSLYDGIVIASDGGEILIDRALDLVNRVARLDFAEFLDVIASISSNRYNGEVIMTIDIDSESG